MPRLESKKALEEMLLFNRKTELPMYAPSRDRNGYPFCGGLVFTGDTGAPIRDRVAPSKNSGSTER